MYTFIISLVVFLVLLLLVFIRLLIEANSKILAMGKNEQVRKKKDERRKYFLIKEFY